MGNKDTLEVRVEFKDALLAMCKFQIFLLTAENEKLREEVKGLREALKSED